MKKKILTALFAFAFTISAAVTVHAAEALDRDTIENAVWEDIWNGKGDNGLDFPEASYKHHILDKWLDENYGSAEYDWSETGEIKYAYKHYYKKLIDGWDFNDDDNGGWTIETENTTYSFMLQDGTWLMIDSDGNTVDSFPPYSTLKEDESETENNSEAVYEIEDEGEESPRVVGEAVAAGDNASSEDDAPVGPSDTEGEKQQKSGANPVPIAIGAAAVAGAVGVCVYVKKKR